MPIVPEGERHGSSAAWSRPGRGPLVRAAVVRVQTASRPTNGRIAGGGGVCRRPEDVRPGPRPANANSGGSARPAAEWWWKFSARCSPRAKSRDEVVPRPAAQEGGGAKNRSNVKNPPAARCARASIRNKVGNQWWCRQGVAGELGWVLGGTVCRGCAVAGGVA